MWFCDFRSINWNRRTDIVHLCEQLDWRTLNHSPAVVVEFAIVVSSTFARLDFGFWTTFRWSVRCRAEGMDCLLGNYVKFSKIYSKNKQTQIKEKKTPSLKHGCIYTRTLQSFRKQPCHPLIPLSVESSLLLPSLSNISNFYCKTNTIKAFCRCCVGFKFIYLN